MPVICLDEIRQRLPGPLDHTMFRTLLREAHVGDRWVSDGNFCEISFDIRLPRAELIVWLERRKILCAWRASLRVFRSGEMHQLRELHTVLVYIRDFERRNRPIIEAERLKHGANVPVVHLRTSSEIAKLLDVLTASRPVLL